MKQSKGRLAALVLLAAVLVLTPVFMVQATQSDTTAPVLTVTQVPDHCYAGQTVVLPAASAVDDTDPSVNESITVSVYQMKNDKKTINRTLLDNQLGNVSQSFIAHCKQLRNFLIVYRCTDEAGNTAEQTFWMTADLDTEAGTLAVNTDSLENFSLETGVTGAAGHEILLPSATAIDLPSGEDISSRVDGKLFLVENGVTTSLVARFSDFSQIKQVRVPAGNYILQLTVRDMSGNQFPTVCEIPVKVEIPYGENLAKNLENFTYNGIEGRAWVNEYGELSYGHTSAYIGEITSAGFSANVAKIYEEYVAITFQADAKPATGGQMFYAVSARGSKDRGSSPTTSTHEWPEYLFLRISDGKIESRVEKTSDASMTTVKAYSGNLLDGKDHTLYLQWVSAGESATASDAAILIYGWVDKTPAVGYDNASFCYKAVAGEEHATGTLEKETFIELWEETGAGWFSMTSYCSSKPYNDDHMRIKGFVIYAEDEKEFGTDILPPQIQSDFDTEKVYARNEEMTIPAAEVDEGAVVYYIVTPDGQKTSFTPGAYTPTQSGEYTLQIWATDEAGNESHCFVSFSVADRDMVAPEMRFDGSQTLTVTVGSSVKLPTVVATDDQDGDISGQVSVEIIGTEHKTGMKPGDTYEPKTAGTQQAIYTVEDRFGNVCTKTVTIEVKSAGKTGNLLAEPMTISGGSNGLKNEEYIYGQKVSMIINLSEFNSTIMFNMRGPVNTANWPTGMVLRFNNLGKVNVSARGHDSYIYGEAVYADVANILDCDILFEYQTQNVTIDGVEYIWTRVWIQGEELVFSASKDGLTGLQSGVGGIYRKVSDFEANADQVENVYSSYFWCAAYKSTLTIKELRTDGTSCNLPEGPVQVEGLPMPTFKEGNNFVTCPYEIPYESSTQVFELGENSNEDYISVTFSAKEAANKGAILLNVLGEAKGWSAGLMFRITQDGFSIRVNGANDTNSHIAFMSWSPYGDGITTAVNTLVYKLTFIEESGVCTGIQIDLWGGEEGGTLNKVYPIRIANEEWATYDEETGAFIVSTSVFTDESKIVPGKITQSRISGLNGTVAWTFHEIKKLETAPGTAVQGYEGILNSNAAEVLISEAVTLPANTDKAVKLVNNVNENYVAVTFKHNYDAEHVLYVNMTGSSGGWDGGIGLRFANDGLYLKRNGVNNATLAQTNIFSGAMKADTEYTFVYKLTYLETNGTYYGVEIEMWFGEAGGTMKKIGCYSVNDTEHCSYDSEKGAFVVTYDAVDSAEKFTPDCTAVSLGAFNADCEFTLVKVEILDAAP